MKNKSLDRRTKEGKEMARFISKCGNEHLVATPENTIMNVIIVPGEIRSKSDGDRHFISARQLINLYGVREFDNVKICSDPRTFWRMFDQERITMEGWLVLEPRYDGNYYSIHSPQLV